MIETLLSALSLPLVSLADAVHSLASTMLAADLLAADALAPLATDAGPGTAGHLASQAEEVRILGVKILNVEDFLHLVLRFALNMVATLVIVRGVYFPRHRRSDYVFTYTLISLTVFVLCISLAGVKLQLGFALGLFAIFGILRYRTDPIPIKEMTYLFVVIGIAVLNALSNKKVSYAELVFANVAVVGILAFLDQKWLKHQTSQKTVVYERVDLIRPDRRKELIADLRNRTGLDVTRVDVGKVSFLRDTAELVVHYREATHPEYVAAEPFIEPALPGPVLSTVASAVAPAPAGGNANQPGSAGAPEEPS